MLSRESIRVKMAELYDTQDAAQRILIERGWSHGHARDCDILSEWWQPGVLAAHGEREGALCLADALRVEFD
jgi:hypothetical protein